MKKVITFIVLLLVALAPMASAKEKDKYPLRNMCQQVESHKQEARWCKTWESALTNAEWIRPAVETDSAFLQTIVLVEFCEKTQTLGVSTTVLFVSPWFAGQYPWLMSNIKVLEVGDWESIAKELVQDMEAGFEVSRDGLADSIMFLNSSRERYKSAEGADEQYFTDDPFDVDMFDLLPKLCAGTNVMFNMSRTR
jgi:hypothetical protein